MKALGLQHFKNSRSENHNNEKILNKFQNFLENKQLNMLNCVIFLKMFEKMYSYLKL